MQKTINFVQSPVKNTLHKMVPETISGDEHSPVRLETEQFSEIQLQDNSEYKNLIVKLNEEKGQLEKKLLEKKNNQKLKRLDEEAEKYRLMWQKAQEKYFKMVGNRETTHLLSDDMEEIEN